MCQPPAPPMTCGRKSSFAVLAGTQTCTANSSEKAGLSPAHSHPGAQNIGPSGLDRGAAAVRSCPRAARLLSARWLSLVRRRVVSESVLVHTHTSSHGHLGPIRQPCEARARAPRSSVSKMHEFVATQQNPAATGRSETAGRRADRRPPGVPDWRKALRQSEGNPAGGWNSQAPARTTHPSAGRLAPTAKRRGAKRGGTHRCRSPKGFRHH